MHVCGMHNVYLYAYILVCIGIYLLIYLFKVDYRERKLTESDQAKFLQIHLL